MKLKYIAIAISLVSLTLVSCNRDEDSLFEKSASERAAEAVNNAMELLPAAGNGWEMVYFPNKENMSTSKGYIMVLRFGKDGSVSATAKNSLTTSNQIKTDVSTWEVISDYGPILSFNTYNEVLHAWSDPQNDGDGYLGDYEFLILSANKDLIILKGKKHSAYSVLRPMKTDDMAAHFAACEKMQADLFGNGNIVTLKQGNNLYNLYNGGTGMFRMAKFGETLDVSTAEHFPMCATADGIVVSYGFGDQPKERIYTFTNNQLVGESGSIIDAGNLNLSFGVYVGENKGWSVDLKQTTGDVLTKVSAFVSDLQTISKDKTKAAVNSLMIGYSASANMYQGAYFVRVRFQYKDGSKTRTENADFEVTMTTSENGVSINYVQPMTDNATSWATAAPSVLELAQTLCGSFVASAAAGHEFNVAGGLILIGNNSKFYLKSATVR